jgi:hemoglobin-like flavoprotein
MLLIAHLPEEMMFSDAEKAVIQRTWRLLVPVSDTLADVFYQRLFELRPDFRTLYPEDMSAQKKKLVRMLAFAVSSLNWNDSDWETDIDPNADLLLVVLALGRRHSELYRIPEDSYPVVGEALLWTLERGLAGAFTEEARAAWARFYALLAQTMRLGAKVIDRDSAMTAAHSAQEYGEAALLAQQASIGMSGALHEITERVT